MLRPPVFSRGRESNVLEFFHEHLASFFTMTSVKDNLLEPTYLAGSVSLFHCRLLATVLFFLKKFRWMVGKNWVNGYSVSNYLR